MSTLRVRRLGRVLFAEADDLQRALQRSSDDYLVLCEHPAVYTLGTTADPAHVLVPPAGVGADLAYTDRGGDVTFHGPGQLVAYPIITLPEWRDGRADAVAHVRMLEDVLIEVCADLGVTAHTVEGLTGVWVGDEKIAAIGVKVSGRRTRHGVALNVDPDLTMFDHIVPCGIRDRGVTSLARVLGATPDPVVVEDALVARLARRLGLRVEEQAVTPPARAVAATVVGAGPAPAAEVAPSATSGRLLARLSAAGVEIPPSDPTFRRPEWMRVKADLGENFRSTKRLMRSLDLVTVCEEAGCPNIYECWADRTATFMILGERCTRACGFCLVDTRHPLAPDADEPARVADAVATLGLEHAVITSVARDDLPDGGAEHFARTIRAVRDRMPRTSIEVLIPDCKGDAEALRVILDAVPDVVNHNLETVARLQRAVRPNAGYARSLTLLARTHAAGLVAKSGLIAGLGETTDEMRAAITDLRNVGVEILTVGQYLQPSPQHAPVARWWTPDEFAELRAFAEGLGFAHVECGPLVRSSYHAKRAVDAAADPADAAPAASAG